MSDGWGDALVGEEGFVAAYGGGSGTPGTGGTTVPPVVPTPGGCTDAICGITDTFTRTIAANGGLGTSDAGLPWVGSSDYGGDNGGLSVDGTSAVLTHVYSGTGTAGYTWAEMGVAPADAWSFTAKVTFSAIDAWSQWLLFDGNNEVLLAVDTTGASNVYCGSGNVHFPFVAGTQYNLHFNRAAGGSSYLNVWAVGDPEPSTPTVTGTVTNSRYSFVLALNGNTLRYPATAPVYIDDLDITGVNRCTEYRFDNFNRTVVGGWGTSDRGFPWLDQFVSGVVEGVDGSAAYAGAGTVAARYLYDPVPFGHGNDFVLTARIRMTTYPPPSITGFVLRIETADLVDSIGFQLDASGGPPSGDFFRSDAIGGVAAGIDPAMTDTSWWNVKLDASVAGLKMWQDGTPEPSGWTWTISPHAGFTPARLYLAMQSAMAIDYIDVDYAGKPCYAGGPVPGTGGGGTTDPLPTPGTGSAVTVGPGARGITITSDNAVIDGYTITGPGALSFDTGSVGIYGNGAYTGVIIRNCVIRGFGGSGIWLQGLINPIIENCIIEDVVYGGIFVVGVTGGRILSNQIRRVGMSTHQADGNAYGIAVTMLAGGLPSTDVLVQDNLVDYVPLWHGLDTHGGYRIAFRHNTVLHCARAIFATANQESEQAHDIEITRNFLSDPQTAPSPGTDANVAITTYAVVGGTITGNVVGTAYPTIYYDTGGRSTGITETGNAYGSALPA